MTVAQMVCEGAVRMRDNAVLVGPCECAGGGPYYVYIGAGTQSPADAKPMFLAAIVGIPPFAASFVPALPGYSSIEIVVARGGLISHTAIANKAFNNAAVKAQREIVAYGNLANASSLSLPGFGDYDSNPALGWFFSAAVLS